MKYKVGLRTDKPHDYWLGGSQTTSGGVIVPTFTRDKTQARSMIWEEVKTELDLLRIFKNNKLLNFEYSVIVILEVQE